MQKHTFYSSVPHLNVTDCLNIFKGLLLGMHELVLIYWLLNFCKLLMDGS